MRIKISIIAALAFAPVVAVAADSGGNQVITVQPGQGSPVAVRIPAPPEAGAPYALTGNNNQAAPVRWVPMQFGQGGPTLVPLPD
jgi:hypothetical protein